MTKHFGGTQAVRGMKKACICLFQQPVRNMIEFREYLDGKLIYI
jgi:hypothetical protein